MTQHFILHPVGSCCIILITVRVLFLFILHHLHWCSYACLFVQRLSTTVKMVNKGVLKDHLILVANSMTCTGSLIGFNIAGYKATFRSLKVQVPFTESTLFVSLYLKYLVHNFLHVIGALYSNNIFCFCRPLWNALRRLQKNAILIHWDVWSHHPHGASMQQLVLAHLFKFSGMKIRYAYLINWSLLLMYHYISSKCWAYLIRPDYFWCHQKALLLVDMI